MKDWTHRGLIFEKHPDEPGNHALRSTNIWRAETMGADIEIHRMNKEKSYWFCTITVRIGGKNRRFHECGQSTRAKAFDTSFAKLKMELFKKASELGELQYAVEGVKGIVWT